MGYPTKIATCCYCGTRAALVLTGQDRHELSCSACGAPLHDMKRLPMSNAASQRKKQKRENDRRSKEQIPTEISGISHQKVPKSFKAEHKLRPKRSRKRSSFFKKAIEEIGDVLEEIFD